MSMFWNSAKPGSMDKITYDQYQWAEKMTLITWSVQWIGGFIKTTSVLREKAISYKLDRSLGLSQTKWIDKIIAKTREEVFVTKEQNRFQGVFY